jgi:hypothetical protein
VVFNPEARDEESNEEFRAENVDMGKWILERKISPKGEGIH